MDCAVSEEVFRLVELFAAGITTIDVIVVFAFLQVRRGRLALALWTAFLNMLFPFFGFWAGEFSAHIFSTWSSMLSGLFLALMGIHMLLQDDNAEIADKSMHPYVIALAVSLDAFSVSVSFGMLQMNKILFIVASGLFTFFFAYIVLLWKGRWNVKNGSKLRRFAGVALLVMGIMSCFR